MKKFDPAERMASGYTSGDGTVEFMLRVNSLLNPSDRVLDVGAGRGAWVESTTSKFKLALRSLKGKCAEYIGVDVDAAVLNNPTTHTNLLIANGVFPVDDESIDLILSDYVLEHVEDPASFVREVNRVLKPGGWFCARTPHKWHYVSCIAQIVKNKSHSRVIGIVQPERESIDVFPTAYRMNTLGDIKRAFSHFDDFSYIYATEPSYYFGREVVYRLMVMAHRILPVVVSGNMMIFMRKP